MSGRSSNQYSVKQHRPAGTTPAAAQPDLVAQAAAAPPEATPGRWRAATAARLSTQRRTQLAVSHETPPATLRDIAGSAELSVLYHLVSNPNCPPDVLRQFKDRPDLGVWYNPNCPGEVLNWALQCQYADPIEVVRHRNLDEQGMLLIAQWATAATAGRGRGQIGDMYLAQQRLAGRADLGEQAMRVLATGGTDTCKYLIADHDFAPPDVLEGLLRDPDPEIAQRASQNPNLPRHLQAMWQLAHGTPAHPA
jgi:hypothetical protein